MRVRVVSVMDGHKSVAEEAENLSVERPEVASPSPTTRSAIANGSRLWIDGVDGRSAEARRFRDVLADLVEHLGGTDWASEPQKHLARRAAALVVSCEKAEMALVNGDEFDVVTYSTSANTLRRLLNDLGLKRHARDSKVEVEHHVQEQADSFTNKIIELAAKRGGDKVDGDTSVPDHDKVEE